MKRPVLSALTVLCLLVLPMTVLGQPACSVRTFGIRDGLAANNISGLGQSPDGLMWIATWNGLCCYDGYQFTTFRSDGWEGDDALSTNRIAMILPDSQGNVWVRTYDSGLYLLDTRQCHFVNVGRRVEQHFGKIIRPRHFYAQPGGRTLITDEQGELNLSADDRHPGDVSHMKRVGQTDIDAVRPPHTDGAQTDTALAWRLTASGLTPDNNAKHLIDRQGNLWLTSSQGLTLANFYQPRMRLLSLVDGQQTRAVLCRRDGTVWAGTQDGYIGVYTADGELQGWLSQQGQVTPNRVRFADRIYAMREDSKGRTWIGTKGQGLYEIRDKEIRDKVHHYMPDPANPYALSHAYVYDIDEDPQGRIWIATYGGGLNLAQPQADGTMRFLHSGNELKGYPMEHFSRIRRITHAPNGTLLISCTEGLAVYSPKTHTTYTSQHRQDTTSLRTSDVMQTLVTRSGQVYIATLGGGIQRLVSGSRDGNAVPRDGNAVPPLQADDLRFQSVTTLNRGTGNVLSMTEDPQSRLWIVRETEVSMYDPQTGRLEQYGPGSMAAPVELAEAQPAIDAEGRLWAGVMGGVLTFSTHEMQKSRFRPNIVFTRLLYQGEQEPQPILNRNVLTVPTDRRSLSVSFAALDYGDHYQLEYAYQVISDKRKVISDEAWNYIGTTPRISFSQLPAGRHVLVVKSTNCDGVWTDNEARLTLDVQPFLWERRWVQLLLLLLVIGLSTWAVTLWQRRRQRNREREQRLEHILQQYHELQKQMIASTANAPQGISSPSPREGLGWAPHHYQLEQPQIVDADQQMMQQLMKFIEQHVSDENLKIDDMAEAVGLGRSVFYEKIKQLVGVSPIDFLRQLRMQRAKELLRLSTMNISEVAYAVGFTDPKYFSRCFKKDTGQTPREYREQKTKDSDE